MAILHIIEAPHPILSKKARPVRDDELDDALRQQLADMAETMYAAPGVGLAAPQVSDSRRILVADPGNQEDDNGEKHPDLLMMVNPEIIERSRERIVYEESCLSVPEYYLDIKRAKRICVRWTDGDGAPHERWFENFASIVLQHELDHLDGKTLLDHSSRFKRSRYISRRRKRTREPAE
ncbi:MAG: peptide deformylase [Myxococcota bacterium]|jgi:peptide deformylase